MKKVLLLCSFIAIGQLYGADRRITRSGSLDSFQTGSLARGGSSSAMTIVVMSESGSDKDTSSFGSPGRGSFDGSDESDFEDDLEDVATGAPLIQESISERINSFIEENDLRSLAGWASDRRADDLPLIYKHRKRIWAYLDSFNKAAEHSVGVASTFASISTAITQQLASKKSSLSRGTRDFDERLNGLIESSKISSIPAFLDEYDGVSEDQAKRISTFLKEVKETIDKKNKAYQDLQADQSQLKSLLNSYARQDQCSRCCVPVMIPMDRSGMTMHEDCYDCQECYAWACCLPCNCLGTVLYSFWFDPDARPCCYMDY